MLHSPFVATTTIALPALVDGRSSARNLLDENRELIKELPFPFDYQQETRRWLVSLRLDV